MARTRGADLTSCSNQGAVLRPARGMTEKSGTPEASRTGHLPTLRRLTTRSEVQLMTMWRRISGHRGVCCSFACRQWRSSDPAQLAALLLQAGKDCMSPGSHQVYQ